MLKVRLPSALVAHLEHRSVIDVEAERGDLAAWMLAASVEKLHAIEPHPDNVRALRDHFESDPQVTVHGHAVSEGDGPPSL
jgi:FkbM family methyltransferase